MSAKKFFNSKPFKFLNNAISIILIVFLLITIFSMLRSMIKKDHIVTTFGYGVAVVISGSMEPAISVNDLIIIKKTDDLYVGDVIVYEREKDMIVHRIIDISGDKGIITTKGDANNAADDPIDRSAVRGSVIFKIPYVGKAVRFIKTKQGIISVLVLLLVSYNIKYLFKRKKQ